MAKNLLIEFVIYHLLDQLVVFRLTFA